MAEPDIVAELDRWLTAGDMEYQRRRAILERARDEIVALRRVVRAQEATHTEIRQMSQDEYAAYLRRVNGGADG